jgi:hypothetical protein
LVSNEFIFCLKFFVDLIVFDKVQIIINQFKLHLLPIHQFL